MSETKTFEELFVVFMFGHFQEGGGDCLIPNFLRNFSACVWTFFRKVGGGYLIPKILRNFSACVWTFFRREGGGLPDSKDDEEHFLV